MIRTRRGDIVAIEFLDQTEGGNTPLRFIVYGRVALSNKNSISVDSWAYPDGQIDLDSNVTRFTILKKAIIKISKLKVVL